MHRLQRQQFVEAGSVPVLAPARVRAEIRRDAIDRLGRSLRRHQAWILPLVWFATVVALRPMLAFEDERGDMLLNLGGLGLILIGQILRAEAHSTILEAGGSARLVTAGTYSMTRNPLCLGALLVHAGILVVFNHPVAYAVGGLAVITAYALIVLAEEPVLGRRFGRAYSTWCREVPRWGLKLSTLPTTFVGRAVAWRHALHEDHAFIATWLVVLTWVAIYDHAVRINGRPDFLVMLTGVVATATVVFAAWLLGALRRRRRTAA